MRRRLARDWRAPLPGVVATFTGAPTPRQRLIAAQLYAGPEAIIGSTTAAAWHGVEAARADPVRLFVPRSSSSRRAGFAVVTRTTRADPGSRWRPPLRFASPARAVIDAARDTGSEAGATAIVIEAVQRRLVTLPLLQHELERSPHRGSRPARAALVTAETNAWSVAEVDLIALVASSRYLPTPWPNADLCSFDGLRLPTPDLWFDDVGLAVQLHSRRYHARDDDWDGTVMGDSLLGEFSVPVVRLTPARVEREPDRCLARIERAHRSAARTGRPDVIATPRAA
ncbi:hypothetical protein ACIB24_12275 [Spongisporangium articulatum]|uniref:Uncharacterized protein n=1 Tax=Spongisporangium articulatum TaxID=3362603 RepID=A0ABW8AQC0_9ACTN